MAARTCTNAFGELGRPPFWMGRNASSTRRTSAPATCGILSLTKGLQYILTSRLRIRKWLCVCRYRTPGNAYRSLDDVRTRWGLETAGGMGPSGRFEAFSSVATWVLSGHRLAETRLRSGRAAKIFIFGPFSEVWQRQILAARGMGQSGRKSDLEDQNLSGHLAGRPNQAYFGITGGPADM